MDESRGFTPLSVKKIENEKNKRKTLNAPSVNLFQEMKERTSELKAFIQTFAVPMTNVMRAMVYFIVADSAEIKELSLNYKQKESFYLKIILDCDPIPLNNPEFESLDLWDIDLMRHFTYMKLSDAPIIDGFLPVKYN